MTCTAPHHLYVAAVCGLLASGCSPQFADPITKGLAADPCLAWVTESECLADTAHGCRVEPNLVGCLTTDPACATHSCRGGNPFVGAAGQTLQLHDEPFRFVGVNSWGIAWAPDGCKVGGFADQDAALARMFDDLVGMRASVARIWAFQPYAGPSGTDYSRFDKVIKYARRANVRLIFVLENGRKDACSKGDVRTDQWFATDYKAPYDDNTLSYPDYVTGLVAKYAAEPTILAWELMHEAGASDFAALNAFVVDMSSRIRGIESKHLISVGLNRGDETIATSRTDGTPSSYQKLHAHGTIDLVDIHSFMSLDSALQVFPPNDDSAESIAKALDKPIFLGALAITVPDNSTASLQKRAHGMKLQIDAAFANGYAGVLLYDYYPDWSTTEATTSFDSRPTDPLGGPNGVIANATKTYGSP